nr:MAG TPA: hypothetical protein [Caudoviricetes sp.]
MSLKGRVVSLQKNITDVLILENLRILIEQFSLKTV